MEGINETLAKAKKARQEARYEEAFSLYSNAILRLICEKESAEKAMIEALECYLKLDPEFQDDASMELQHRYYAMIRYSEDHRIADQACVNSVIHKQIPSHYYVEEFAPQQEGSSVSLLLRLMPYTAALDSAQGPRAEMEDAHFLKKISFMAPEKHTAHLFAVLDGHGGLGCALFSAAVLPERLLAEFQKMHTINDTNLYNAIVKAFVTTDNMWKKLPLQETSAKDYSGTTVALAIIIDKKDLWIANVGDSGAMLACNGTPRLLTEPAKPSMPKYMEEIYRRGGFVAHDRVDGCLDMARSIGDIDHPSVSARPTITKVTEKCAQLILACDGLWDVVDPQLAAEAIKGMATEKASNTLRKLAHQRGSMDNVTVMVIDLEPV